MAKDALVHVVTRLRANLFDREGALPTLLPVLPYLPVSADGPDGVTYDSRDSKRHGRGHSYSGGYGASSDLTSSDSYGSYGGSQVSCQGPILFSIQHFLVATLLCVYVVSSVMRSA